MWKRAPTFLHGFFCCKLRQEDESSRYHSVILMQERKATKKALVCIFFVLCIYVLFFSSPKVEAENEDPIKTRALKCLTNAIPVSTVMQHNKCNFGDGYFFFVLLHLISLC